MNIYQRIRQRREELGMSQEQLANKLGYKSKSTINKIEMGINDVTQSKVVLFAEALQTTPAYLMGWEEPEKNDIHTLAAHFEGEEYTEEELEEIYNFAEFVKNKRK